MTHDINHTKTPGILFTSPCGPYEKVPVDRDPIDYFYYRNTLKQKMFQLRSYQSWHSLHFLAQNLPVRSVVLENPAMKVFQKEVQTGSFGIVAIGFTILLSRKVLEMARWLKQNHPNIEIVLGGYGTAIFNESCDTTQELKMLVDHICHGEGLSFMNTLIEKKWNIKNELPLFQDLLPSRNSFFRTHIELFKQIVLVGGLGCVYGCSFCATSSQFNGRYIPLFSGRELFESLLNQYRKHPHIQSAIIYDEDFLLHREKVMEFRDCFMKSELSQKPILLTVFASIKTILDYTLEELVDCGIGTIFIGVESMNDKVLGQEGLVKRRGKADEIFEQLHSHGINTLGSLVIGWDSQSIETARADAELFVQLNPTFYQVVPLHAVPGTRLWEKMKATGRILPGYRSETDGINEFNFETKHFSTQKGRELVFKTYKSLVDEGGPWPFRMFENLIRGYSHLRDSENASFKKRATLYRRMILPICLLAFASGFLFGGRGFKTRWRDTMTCFARLSPWWFAISVLTMPLTLAILIIVYLSGNMRYHFNPSGDQPDYKKTEYNNQQS
jgi:radical SAM superfamily enzyme YgiQ (UPF0313 family)